jgi:hypothetical protein
MPTPAPERLHRELHALHHLAGIALHDDGVLVQQRLTLSSVGDQRIGLGCELHRGRESTATRANDAGPTNEINKIGCHHERYADATAPLQN